MMRTCGIGAILIGVICAAAFAFVSNTDQHPVTDAERRWQDAIEQLGPEKAYADFVAAQDGATQQEQHMNAHAFGGALYRVRGIGGLLACDERFSYGCFHQFIGEAIQESGMEVVSDLWKTCGSVLGERSNACLHSIGHGIVATTGYADAGLMQALALCDEAPNVSDNRPFSTCKRGAFMEYNFRTMQDADASARELVDGDLYHPCRALEGVDRATCFYSQPQWWRQLLRQQQVHEVRNIAERVGEYCAGADPDMQSTCYAGVGAMIAWDFDGTPSERSALCTAVSPRIEDRTLCVSHVAYWLPRINAVDPAAYDPTGACSALPEEQQSVCHGHIEEFLPMDRVPSR